MLALLLGLSLVTAVPDTLELTLDQALGLALKRSPARLEVSASRTQTWVRAGQGVAALLPTPSGSLTYGEARSQSPLLPDSTVRGWSGSLALSQVVFDPQVFAGVVNSFIYSGYSATEARDKQARLGHDVIVDYLNLLKTRQLRDVAASALARADDNLNLNQEKLRLGSAARIDVMRAEVFRSQTEIDLLTAEKAVAAANAAFLATTGVTENVAVKPTEELLAPPDSGVYDTDSLLDHILRSNPGIRLADKADAAARISVAAAAARALPQVSAYWSSDYADSLPPGGLTDWKDHSSPGWGLRFGFPLLDLKSYVLDIAAASAESRLARAGAARVRLQLRSAATAALLGYNESRQRLTYAERNLELNQELFRLAEEQRRLGSISLIDFQSVETSLAQAQASRASALCDVYIQAAEIAYLMGITGR